MWRRSLQILYGHHEFAIARSLLRGHTVSLFILPRNSYFYPVGGWPLCLSFLFWRTKLPKLLWEYYGGILLTIWAVHPNGRAEGLKQVDVGDRGISPAAVTRVKSCRRFCVGAARAFTLARDSLELVFTLSKLNSIVNSKSISYLLLTLCIALVRVGLSIGATDGRIVLWTNTLVTETIAGHPQGRACCWRICTAAEIAHWWICIAWTFTLARDSLESVLLLVN